MVNKCNIHSILMRSTKYSTNTNKNIAGIKMDSLKEKSVRILCELGKYGIGKSLTLGMYDFEIPQKLQESKAEEKNGMKINRNDNLPSNL